MLELTMQKTIGIGLMANFIALGCCMALVLSGTTNLYNNDIYFYVSAVIVYGILLLCPLGRCAIHNSIWFVVKVCLLGYLYTNTPNNEAIILLYLYAIQLGMQFNRRYSLLGAGIIAIMFAITSIIQFGLSQQYIWWVLMHTLLIMNMNIMAQHVSFLERKSREQIEKNEQRLKLMEQSYNEVSILAEKDGLTDLYNYRTFRNELSQIHTGKIGILVIDVDNFKNFNDAYGHLCGDAVLKEVAAIMKNSFREVDMIFRYGGEEFAVIMKGVSEAEVQAAALRVANNVDNHQFNFNQEKELHITISIGYAVSDANDKTADELFKIADLALYNAKNSGRNLIGCPNGEIYN